MAGFFASPQVLTFRRPAAPRSRCDELGARLYAYQIALQSADTSHITRYLTAHAYCTALFRTGSHLGGLLFLSATSLERIPRLPISTSILSPGCKNIGGCLPIPTPAEITVVRLSKRVLANVVYGLVRHTWCSGGYDIAWL